jgi:hypothetical protein
MKLSPELLLEHCDEDVLKQNFELSCKLLRFKAVMAFHENEQTYAWRKYKLERSME